MLRPRFRRAEAGPGGCDNDELVVAAAGTRAAAAVAVAASVSES
jgi:hypothetical protein